MEIGAPAVVNIVKGDHDPANTDTDPDHNQYYHDLVNLPPGFRFHPTDEEIITHYLTQKVIKPSFTASAIGQVDLNKCEPWDLPQKAKMGEKEWYFFCQRDRKYPTGMRTNRATDSGYWKATGKDKEIYKHGRHGCLVGMKKTLVFYMGRAPKGEKTNWVMHEFRLQPNFSYYNFPKASKDEWVVSKVFHKNSSGGIKRSPVLMSRDDHQQGRMKSFVDGLLDSPTSSSSLPPLVDAPPADYYKRGAGSSSFSNDKKNNIDIIEEKSKFKGSAAWCGMSSDDGDQYKTGTFLMRPYSNYNLNTNSHEAAYSQLTLPNHPHGSFQANTSNSGRQYLLPPSSNNHNNQYSTMMSHSQDTGLSTADMNTEISSSVVSKLQDITTSVGAATSLSYEIEDPDDDHNDHVGDGAPSLSYLDSFWEY